MRARLRSHLTYANVVATLALFVALGGGSYAALTLPRNSVGTEQLKRGAINSQKIRDGAVRLRDIRRRDRSALAGADGADGAAGQPGPAGAPGPPGDKGDKGDTGAAGDPTSAVIPSGKTVIGGWIVDGETVGGGDDLSAYFALPAAAPVPLADDRVTVAGYETPDPCTGNPDNPTAPPGHVCAYYDTSGADDAITGYGTGRLLDAGARHGFVIELGSTSSANSDLFARGTWAYTAP